MVYYRTEATLLVVGLEKAIAKMENFMLEFRASRAAPLMTFPTFDGSGALTWLARANQYFFLNKTPLDSRVDVAMNTIIGPAKPWKQLHLNLDPDVAKRMLRFMEISTIGVSKEAQLRAISILEMISTNNCLSNFFDFGQSVMAARWKKLREALQGLAAYAWMKGQEGTNLEEVMKEEKIRVRGGETFGCPNNYARLSMLVRDKDVDLLLKRLPSILKRLAH